MGRKRRAGGNAGLVLMLVFALSLAVPVLLGEQVAAAGHGDTWAIDHLSVGDRVMDESWDWEFRTDDDYEFRFADDREPRPVIWIVVAKNHYRDSVAGDHITLVAEELIGRYHFDGDNDNHWGTSDLRTWLNGFFYDAMSPAFQNMLLETAVPNKEWEAGDAYSTTDKVFIPSVTEMGADADTSYEIGSSWNIFADDDSRKAALGGRYAAYWTRSPHRLSDRQLHTVHWGGNITFSLAHRVTNGVRPVVNVPSTVQVSRTPDEGIHAIKAVGEPAKADKPDDVEDVDDDPAVSVITVRPGASIQAAIDAAQDGDTVYVKAGTYEERIHFKSGITLRGEGRDVTTITYTGEAPVVTVHDASSGTITGFTVWYAGEGRNSAVWVRDARLSIMDCVVGGAGLSGISVSEPGSDVLLSNNVIRDNAQSGIFIYGGARGTVRGNEIYDNGFQGISVRDTGTDPLIESNVLRDNTQNGIFIYGRAQGTMRGNEIYANVFQGISVRDTGTDPLIANNVIRDNAQSGIFVYEGAQGTMRGNEVYGNGFHGFSVRDTGTDPLIANNVIRDNTQNGIFIRAGAQGTVRGNEVRGSGLSAISVSNAGTDPLIETNILRDNTQSGIYIYEGARGTVRGNEIYGNGFHGTSIRHTDTDALIENNVIRDNTQSGVFIRAGARGTVRGNEIYGNGYRGIGVVNAGTMVAINRNTIAFNDSHGVWVYDEAQATLTHNIIVQNGSRGVAADRADHLDGQVTLSHNNVWGNEAGDYRGVSAHPTDLSADPQFVDVDARDFRLRHTSPVIGAVEEERVTGVEEQPGFGTLTDIDGNVYTTVIIGTQEWTVENLRTTRYADGTPIPTNLPEEEWWNTEQGAYTVYPYQEASSWDRHPMPHREVLAIASREALVGMFGKLYNGYAVQDGRGLAPAGWRVATDDDWKTLEAFVDSQYGLGDPEWDRDGNRGYDVGRNLRHANLWPDRVEGPNEYGFSATPGGMRVFGSFIRLGKQGSWWTSSKEGVRRDGEAWSRSLYVHDSMYRQEEPKNHGLSVRLVRDVP